MKLAELQRFFAAAATSHSGEIAGLAEVFLGSESLSPSARLAIYNRGYYYRLLDALASVFRQTKRLMGDAAFERQGLAYLAQHASDHPAVERVGRAFSEFLRARVPDSESFLADVAALEWLRLCALVAPNPTGRALPSALEPASFSRSRLCFVKSLHCLSLSARALGAFEGNDAPTSGSVAQTAVAVWRRDHAVCQTELEPQELVALRAALGGAVMSDVCAVFDTGEPEADALRAFQVIDGWFARKWLESVEFFGP